MPGFRITVTCTDTETAEPLTHVETVDAATEAHAAQAIPKLLTMFHHNGMIIVKDGVWSHVAGSRFKDLKATISPLISLSLR